MKLKESILAAAMLVAVPMQAQALTSTATMNVSATQIAPTASLSTSPIAFGNTLITTNQVTATGSITANVTATVPYLISIDKGVNAFGTGTCRRMQGAGLAYRGYELFTDNAYTTLWGDSDLANTCAGKTNNGGASLAATGTGSNQAFTVYARGVYSGTSAGAVSDTLTVTVTY